MLSQQRGWKGSAAELAEIARQLLADLGREDRKLNERLVRYYVQKKVVTAPGREGGEAGGFGYRQLLELIVARELLQDRWPLEKIAAWNASADEKSLLDLIDSKSCSAPAFMRSVIDQGVPETRRLVLAVNDDPLADRDVYAWLAVRGAAVLRAYSTLAALALTERARVHVVISDLARVEGEVLNKRAGIDLARRIRERGSDVPLVIYTMDKTEHVRRLALDAGANYVTEDPDDLRDWLEKIGI